MPVRMDRYGNPAAKAVIQRGIARLARGIGRGRSQLREGGRGGPVQAGGGPDPEGGEQPRAHSAPPGGNRTRGGPSRTWAAVRPRSATSGSPERVRVGGLVSREARPRSRGTTAAPRSARPRTVPRRSRYRRPPGEVQDVRRQRRQEVQPDQPLDRAGGRLVPVQPLVEHLRPVHPRRDERRRVLGQRLERRASRPPAPPRSGWPGRTRTRRPGSPRCSAASSASPAARVPLVAGDVRVEQRLGVVPEPRTARGPGTRSSPSRAWLTTPGPPAVPDQVEVHHVVRAGRQAGGRRPHPGGQALPGDHRPAGDRDLAQRRSTRTGWPRRTPWPRRAWSHRLHPGRGLPGQGEPVGDPADGRACGRRRRCSPRSASVNAPPGSATTSTYLRAGSVGSSAPRSTRPVRTPPPAEPDRRPPDPLVGRVEGGVGRPVHPDLERAGVPDLAVLERDGRRVLQPGREDGDVG